MTKYHFDVLVIGSGLAGLYSALKAAEWCKVAVVTKSTLEQSSTFWAQGGIAAALDKEDSPQFHFNDTIKAGRNFCDQAAADILVTEGAERVKELIDMGMEFDKEGDYWALGLEGGHSQRRVFHAGGDATGNKLVKFLVEKIVANKNISVFENTLVYELISNEGFCYGAYAYDFKRNENITFFSNATVIGAGGASGIFQRTTNPYTSTGDGVALAYNAGAQISDMEFIQFHPTAFYSGTGETFLISEAVRGEGAYLVNDDGKRFMVGYHPDAELAPRDIVARTIFNEMKRSGSKNVFLKLDHLDKDFIQKRFSHIYDEVKKFNLDFTKDLTPVTPAAHYMIGGIRTGLEAETNIKRLFACGEVSNTGVHGANRLASNSLLECVVFGERAADSALSLEKEYIDSSKMAALRDFYVDDSKEKEFIKLKNEVARIMTDRVGIVRSRESLTAAITSIEKISDDTEFEKHEYYSEKLRSLIDVSLLIARGAVMRKESRGSHFRGDYPEENPEMLFRIVQQKGKDIKHLNINFNENLNDHGHGDRPKKCC
ncbi:MAG: L-aspartate oxidase [Ignavibacteria bacterium RBG_13_36_8]|nr:MAG: L-aspartate oxidase [Ignavibacteria bacterium RBG_13_36_8]